MFENTIPPVITPFVNKPTKKRGEISNITLDQVLGKGGFGTVYLCHDDNGNELAVKCIKTKDFGIPSLIEASIMSVIHHPNLTKALKIHSTPQKLYIIQELAISDLRIYRQNNHITDKLTIKWIHKIAQGLSCLHKHGIIHGDLKASNILVYPEHKIKITDFTLSTDKCWSKNYTLCTPSHRPLEVWLNEECNMPVDIWSFGCTIFELVYGKSLFVSQNKEQSVNALIDWYN